MLLNQSNTFLHWLWASLITDSLLAHFCQWWYKLRFKLVIIGVTETFSCPVWILICCVHFYTKKKRYSFCFCIYLLTVIVQHSFSYVCCWNIIIWCKFYMFNLFNTLLYWASFIFWECQFWPAFMPVWTLFGRNWFLLETPTLLLIASNFYLAVF